jgi:hypothetical protein
MEIGMENNLQKATEEATLDLRRLLPLSTVLYMHMWQGVG